MSKIRAAVIGVGHQGENHVHKLASHPKVELVGLSDTNVFRGKQVSKQYHVPFTPDYHELLGKIDAVCIAVPVTSHFPIVQDFLLEGTDVFVEKALTPTLPEGEVLIDIAKRNKKILQVGHSERFNGATDLLGTRMIAPSYIEAYRLAGFTDRGHDVDVITDLMIHDIDIVLHLLRESHPEIHAIGTSVMTPQIDIADVHLTFESCEVHLKASRVSSSFERSLKVFEPNRCLVADFLEQDLSLYEKENGKIQKKRFFTGKKDMLEFQICAFIESIEKRSPPLYQGEESLAALHLVEEIRESIQEPHSRESYLNGDTVRRSAEAI